MADISKVRMLNGTEYNYKDAKARSDIEGLKADLGNLSNLDTTDKSSIVAAINELADGGVETDTTLSVSGAAADSAIVGTRFTAINSQLAGIGTILDAINGEVV